MRKNIVSWAIIASLSICAAPVLAADIVDTMAKDRSFKVFAAALETAGLTQTLKNTGPYTVFAPTNEAFSKLPSGAWEQLSQDKVKLAKVLSYHVIPGKVTVAEVKPGNVKTIEGNAVKLTSDNGKVTVNQANITQSDISADNGIVHAIDSLVLPPS